MTDLLSSTLFAAVMALLSWWLGTGAILWLVRLPAHMFRRSMSLLTLLLVLSLIATGWSMREQSVINALEAGIDSIQAMVPRIYENLDPRLTGAAALSCFAHLEDLVARERATCDTALPTLQSRYTPA